ncbi:MAG: cytoskeletal protein RodZ [Syntrophorhabdus sp. PtaB.Bin184]|jgi:transcriptional regulator with XRE-family HTH domain|nr:MAG: cytoskeletal protein RodZ [Syntrophorhabdus sp. PtaB.Bin184]
MLLDLQKIGETLREKREEKGLTIVNISDSLCLRKSLVQAIENGDWSVLPHEVYVRGYLREYAHLLDIKDDVLGLDVPAEETVMPEVPVTREAVSQHRRVGKRAIFYPLIFVLIIAFFVLNQLYNERSASKSTSREVAQPASVNVRTTTGDQAALPEFVEVKKLMVTCHERTWVSVVIDGTEKKEFMLNPEDIIVLNAKDNFDLLLGNAGGVKLNLNGKEVELTGKSGEVKRIKVS